MSAIDGKNIRLKIDTVFLFGVTTTDINFTTDEIDTTTFESAGDKEALPGERGSTINASILNDPAATSGGGYEDLWDAWKAGTIIAFIYGGTESGDLIFTGNCFLTSMGEVNSKNEASNVSVTLKVTGAVAKSTV